MNEEANSMRARASRPRATPAVALAEAAPTPEPLEPDPRFGPGPRPPRPRLKKLRLAFVVLGLSILAIVSAAFGLVMAVASDLPKLENREEFKHSKNTEILDVNGKPLGILTNQQNRVILSEAQVPKIMHDAIVSVEDKRFDKHPGVDIQGIARAAYQDIVSQKPVQGASTITEQFVKNALQAQGNRTIFEKLREAALAYHLTRKWSKKKVLTEYLNTVYFGNGAYGVESAAKIYFGGRGQPHEGCGENHKPLCVSQLRPDEAAMLAGLVASPSAYDPVQHPAAARARRDLVLKDMLAQHYIDPAEHANDVRFALPGRGDVQPPKEESKYPYFTTWIKQQVVQKVGPQQAFAGGLKVHTTLDSDLQDAAQQAISTQLSGVGPGSALVAIDNRTGEVRAMAVGPTGGLNPTDFFAKHPFNIATQGQRQPGSAFKPFVLAQALREGISPDSVWASKKKIFTVPHTRGKEHFVVKNFNNAYSGSSTLARATTYSDNSVFSEVGIKTGVRKISKLAQRMGIRTPVSHNYAITLGALKRGVSPLDMAHAYETLARKGLVTSGKLGAPDFGPVGIERIDLPGRKPLKNTVDTRRVLSSSLVNTETSILQTVVSQGTAKNAQYGGFAAGKTGTTENYGDAWFIGFTHQYTVAVWVGYPDRTKPMRTEFNGGPVEGGTFPAQIWRDFIVSAKQIDAGRKAPSKAKRSGNGASSSTSGQGTTSGGGTSTTGSGTGSRGHRGHGTRGTGTGGGGGGGGGGGTTHGGGGGTPRGGGGGGGTPRGGGGGGGGGGTPRGGGGGGGGTPQGGGGGASPGGGASAPTP